MLAIDSIKHLKAGTLPAAFGAALGAGWGFGMAKVIGFSAVMTLVLVLVCAGVGALIAAGSAGITKEKADQIDNEIHPGMHSVELRDAAWTTAPGAVLCIVLCTLAYQVGTGGLQWAA